MKRETKKERETRLLVASVVATYRVHRSFAFTRVRDMQTHLDAFMRELRVALDFDVRQWRDNSISAVVETDEGGA